MLNQSVCIKGGLNIFNYSYCNLLIIHSCRVDPGSLLKMASAGAHIMVVVVVQCHYSLPAYIMLLSYIGRWQTKRPITK